MGKSAKPVPIDEIRYFVIGRYTPTEVWPPNGHEFHAIPFQTRRKAENWLKSAQSVYYPEAVIVPLLDPWPQVDPEKERNA